MLKYILPALVVFFSAHAYAVDVDVPVCAEGMVWDATESMCVKAPVVTPDDGVDMHKDMKTMDMDSGK